MNKIQKNKILPFFITIFFIVCELWFVGKAWGECDFENLYNDDNNPEYDENIFVKCDTVPQLENGAVREGGLKKFCEGKEGNFYILKGACQNGQGCSGICGATFECGTGTNGTYAIFLNTSVIEYVCHCTKNGNGDKSSNQAGLCKKGCLTRYSEIKTKDIIDYNKSVNENNFYSPNKHHFYLCQCEDDGDCQDDEICYNGVCHYKLAYCGEGTGEGTCDLTKNVCHKVSMGKNSDGTIKEQDAVCINKFCNSYTDCGKCQETTGCKITDSSGKVVNNGDEVPLEYITEVDNWACVDHVCVDLSCAGKNEYNAKSNSGDHTLDEDREYNCTDTNTSCNVPNGDFEIADGLKNNNVGSTFDTLDLNGTYLMKNFTSVSNDGDVGCQYCAYRKGRFCSELHRGYKCKKTDGALFFSKGYQRSDNDILGYDVYGIRVLDFCHISLGGVGVYVKFKCPDGGDVAKTGNKYLDEIDKRPYPYFSSEWKGKNYKQEASDSYNGLSKPFPKFDIYRDNRKQNTGQSPDVNLYLDDFIYFVRINALRYIGGINGNCNNDVVDYDYKVASQQLYNDALSFVSGLKENNCTGERCCGADKLCKEKIDREVKNIENYIGDRQYKGEEFISGLVICRKRVENGYGYPAECPTDNKRATCSCNVHAEGEAIFF